MKKLISVAAALLITAFGSQVFAASAIDNNKTIVKIGAQFNSAYIQFSPALTIAGGCLFDIVYIQDTNTAAGKAYLAMLLTAYAQGKPITRVDYANAGPGQQCFVSLVEVQ